MYAAKPEPPRRNGHDGPGADHDDIVFEQAPIGMAVVGIDGHLLRVNRSLRDLLGYPGQENLPQAFADLLPPDDRLQDEARFDQLVRGKIASYRTAPRLLAGSGAVTSAWLIITPLTGRDGRVCAALATVDATPCRPEAGAQRGGEARHQDLVERLGEGIFILDAAGRLVFVNGVGCALAGYARDELLGLPAEILVPEELRGDQAALIEQFRAGQPTAIEWRLRRKDGTILPIEVSASRQPDGHVLGIIRDISARVQAEAALRESESRFRALIKEASDMISIRDAEGALRYVSPAVERLLGYRPEELVGLPPAERDRLVHPDDAPRVAREYRAVLARPGLHAPTAYRLRHRDGSWRHIEAIRTNLLDDPAVRGVVVNARDITERTRSEEELRENALRYALATAAGGVGVWDRDLATDRVHTDPVLRTMLGNEGGGLRTYSDLLARVHLEDRDRVRDHDRAALATDALIDGPVDAPFPEIEYRMLRPDGDVRWFLARGTVLRRADGEPYRVVGTLTGITARKEAEAARRQSEKRFRTVWELSPIAMGLSDPEGVVLAVNPACCALYGYTEGELVGQGFERIVPPERREWSRARYRATFAGGEVGAIVESTVRRPDGAERIVESHLGFLEHDGRRVAMLSLARDTTEHRLAEERTRATQQLLQSTIDALSAHIAILDERATIVAVNAAWRHFAAEQAPPDRRPGPGDNYLAVCDAAAGSSAEAAQAAAGIRSVLSGERDVFRLVYICPTPAEDLWFRLSVSRFPAGDAPHLVVAHEDITELKRAEETLHDLTGRLLRLQDEERRRLARELHDMTAQNLAALTMGLARAQQRLDSPDATVGKLLAESRALGEQTLREVRTLSYLLHPPLLEQSGLELALPWYVEGFIGRSGIAVELDLAPEVGRLGTDAELALFRVVQESLTNIHRHSGSGRARIALSREAGEIVLRVRDYGGGIAAGQSGATPDSGPILGVGIPGMRERLRQLGGRLDIRSGRGGTTIVAVVPGDDGGRR